MAYFDKDIYFKKQIYAERKMIENREIENSLNEKQKNTIENICTIRHRIHSDPKAAEQLYYTGSADFTAYWQLIDTEYCDNVIKMMIKESGLPELAWQCDMCDYHDDTDESPCGNDEYTDAVFELSGIVERWNDAIENWLARIDEAYGTSYCPTGLSRRF